MSNFKPMLALDHNKLAKPGEDPAAIPAAMRFPVDVQPKLDGIRIVVKDGQALTRTLKRIPNREIYEALSKPELEGLDGEIIVGDPRDDDAYRRTTSFAMAQDKTGEPWTYWVFDKHDEPGTFEERSLILQNMQLDYLQTKVLLVHTARAEDAEELSTIEKVCVEQGYEGVITRNPDGRYKYGRGGKSVQELIKVKRFIDFEAEVIDAVEEQHNANVATINALGRTERSTAKDGKVGKGTLGALVVRALNGPCKGQEFKVGTGFDAQMRVEMWERWQDDPTFKGDIIKVKSFPVGVKEKPRFPVFLGFRAPEDM